MSQQTEYSYTKVEHCALEGMPQRTWAQAYGSGSVFICYPLEASNINFMFSFLIFAQIYMVLRPFLHPVILLMEVKGSTAGLVRVRYSTNSSQSNSE